jgi:hypothetical protein
MTASVARQELERIKRLLRNVEGGRTEKDENTPANEAGHWRRKVDDIIRFIRETED